MMKILIGHDGSQSADAALVDLRRRFSSALERFQLGSVATALVTKAHCSVEVARNSSSNGGEY